MGWRKVGRYSALLLIHTRNFYDFSFPLATAIVVGIAHCGCLYVYFAWHGQSIRDASRYEPRLYLAVAQRRFGDAGAGRRRLAAARLGDAPGGVFAFRPYGICLFHGASVVVPDGEWRRAGGTVQLYFPLSCCGWRRRLEPGPADGARRLKHDFSSCLRNGSSHAPVFLR